MKKINKKGLIDSVIANVAILIPLLIVMVLFVIASYVLAGFRSGNSSPVGSSGFSSNSFLVTSISVDGKNVLIGEEMLREEREHTKYIQGGTFSENFRKGLTDLALAEKSSSGNDFCIYLAVKNGEASKDSNPLEAILVSSNQKIPLDIPTYAQKAGYVRVSYTDNSYYLSYYSGECLGGNQNG